MVKLRKDYIIRVMPDDIDKLTDDDKLYVEDKYGKEEAKKRIYATTDKARGALKSLADDEGYETFKSAEELVNWIFEDGE